MVVGLTEELYSEGNVLGENWHEAEYPIWYCASLLYFP